MLLGIKKTWGEHICQYVSMFIHPTWWLGLIMFHCGVETLQFVDGKDLYLRLVDEFLVEWVEPTHQNLGPLVLAHSTSLCLALYGIVVLKHARFLGSTDCNAYCASWNAIRL